MTTDPSPSAIRRIRASEGWLLRDLRRRSLTDAPDAFGQALDEAREQPGRDWESRARQSARGDARAWFVAERDGAAVGLVQGRRRQPGTLLVFSMWVEGRYRRTGTGRALIEATEAWAREWHATETVLWVFPANRPAVEFYRRLGFQVMEDGDDAESGTRYGALAMRRSIEAVG